MTYHFRLKAKLSLELEHREGLESEESVVDNRAANEDRKWTVNFNLSFSSRKFNNSSG